MGDPIKALDPEQGVKGVAVAITVSTQITDRRSIVLQTYLDRDADVIEYHDTLDKIGKAVDRQEAKYRLEELKKALETHQGTLKQLEADYQRIGERAAADWKARGKQGEAKLAPNEQSQKSTAEQNIKRYRVEIEKVKAEITACEGLIAKDD